MRDEFKAGLSTFRILKSGYCGFARNSRYALMLIFDLWRLFLLGSTSDDKRDGRA